MKRKIGKNAIKKMIGCATSPIARAYQVKNDCLTAFVFHDVSNYPSRFALQCNLNVSPETFRQQILWINKNFNVIHPQDLVTKTPLPKRAALITFDDGFLGAFNNGLDFLIAEKIPSIMFLNMRAILEERPILSAIIYYLDRYIHEFGDFTTSVGLSTPFHLTMTPYFFNLYEQSFGQIDFNAVLDYQGRFANLETVKKWNDKNLVVYGNHLFDHWNAAALTLEEFKDQYLRNQNALSQLSNSIELFSFTNGQPGSCFSDKYVNILNNLGSKKVFSSAGNRNSGSNKYLIDRISLTEEDTDEDYLWFKFTRSIYGNVLSNFITSTKNSTH
ncbi:polysaccharide deacetylase family protein [Bacteroidota bacterium]